ncbi:MAG: hemolysin III family protein [Anaerovoracaceae bacterium]
MEKLLGNPRDEWSFKTHFIGAILAVVGTVYIIISHLLLRQEETGRAISFIVFAISLIALYSCSAIYHYSNAEPATYLRLRKLDHSMIYVLIAGSYTPILFNGMPYPKSYIYLGIMWGFAIVGIIVKVFWMNAPRWLYTSIYILMGWAIIFDIKSLKALPSMCIIFLVIGGISYTTGAVMYILKKPNFFKKFGFHEIFHVFIMFGSLFHFMAVMYI